MRYPEFLQDNGRIGFIAPSFGVVIEPYHTCFESAKKKLSEAGYELVLGPNVYADKGVGKSNTAQACGEEINDFFTNDKSDIIISVGGGETMCEDLEFVDFNAIAKAKPKWYIGYSDNTNLTMTLPTLCDTAAIYGPCASAFGMEPWHEAVQDAFDVLRGKKLSLHNYDKWELAEKEDQQPLETYNATEAFSMRIDAVNVTANVGGVKESVRESSNAGTDHAEFSGRLLGGCIDVLNIMCGTKFDKVKEFEVRYADDGIIWFLEACELNPIGVRRVLWQLKEAGWFKTAKGFLIGRPMMYGIDSFGLNHDDAVRSILGDLNVPIIYDVDLGHLPPMMPLISGALADVKASAGSLKIDMKLA